MATGSAFPLLADAAWLQRVYVVERRTTENIATLAGCSTRTVRRALERHGIPTRMPFSAECYPLLDDAEWLRRTYEDEHQSVRSVAALAGCGVSVIRRELRRHGIAVRGRGVWTKHGHRRATAPSPTYSSWAAMRQRCLNPRSQRWEQYGGRGITVCERWVSSFPNFLEDMGERPEGTSIDRIDVNGNYEPGNCRWGTTAQQVATRRVSIPPEMIAEVRRLLDEGLTCRAVAAITGVSRGSVGTVRSRRA